MTIEHVGPLVAPLVVVNGVFRDLTAEAQAAASLQRPGASDPPAEDPAVAPAAGPGHGGGDPPGGASLFYRVLWRPQDEPYLVWIRLFDDTAWPEWVAWDDVIAWLATGRLRAEDDPYAAAMRAERELSAKARKRRDERWDAVRPLVTDPERRVLRPGGSGRVIAAQAKAAKSSRWTLYTLCRLYWQRGQTPNALQPEFGRCGGPGSDRLARAVPGAPKIGAPSGEEKDQGVRIGRNVSHEWQRLIVVGARRYIEKRRLSVQSAYDETMGEYFASRVVGDDGALTRVLWPVDRRPTIDQFRYWYERHRHPAVARQRLEGLRGYLLRRRAVLGTTADMALGPGALYQIDATLGDVYLLSSIITNRVIGRPVIYLVLDHFSEMIVGLHVALEGPKWLTMAMALENAFTDKVAYCARYGITITPDAWPCAHLCAEVLGDRGELLSAHADELANGLGITVGNTATARADWKALVEGSFRTLVLDLIHGWLPGEVHDRRDRGDPDYRLDAKLTLHDFTRLMIRFVLYYNHHHRIRRGMPLGYVPDEYDDPTPIELWRWGLVNRSGHLHAKPLAALHAHLLPSAPVRVDRRGAHLNGLRYRATSLEAEGWFVEDGRGSLYLEGGYDPRDVGVAFLRAEGGRPPERLTLTGGDERYAGRTLEEVHDEVAWRAKANQQAAPERLQAKLTLGDQRQAILDEAAARQAEVAAATGERVAAKDVRAHRKAEQLVEHRRDAQLAAAALGDAAGPGTGGGSEGRSDGVPRLAADEVRPATVAGPEVQDDAGAYVAPVSHASLLRSLRKRRLGE